MGRTLAIGDIHGCYDALLALIELAGIHREDILVTLGDYVDRGPRSKQVLDWLLEFDRTHQLVPLRGNHELMMCNARVSKSDKLLWGRAGGIETLDSYSLDDKNPADLADVPDAHWEFLTSRLVPFYENDTHFFVHGCVDSDIPLERQVPEQLYWGRYSSQFRQHVSGKLMVCGHKRQDSGFPATNGCGICIDTGAYNAGWLTCLDAETGQVWQANQQGATRRYHMSDLGTNE